MGMPGSLCPQIRTSFKSFDSKIPVNSKHPPAPTKQTGEHSPRLGWPPLCHPTVLGFITALDVFQLGKKKEERKSEVY